MASNKRILKAEAALLLTLTMLFSAKNVEAEDPYAEEIAKIYNIEVFDRPKYAEELLYDIDALPEGLKEYLIKNKLNIKLLAGTEDADRFLKEEYGYSIGEVNGYTSYGDDGSTTIYVECGLDIERYKFETKRGLKMSKEEFGYLRARDTLFHEMGHFIDGVTDFELSYYNDEFEDIRCDEWTNYRDTDHFKNVNLSVYANIRGSVEYFATTFACYMTEPEVLKENCPRTYEYIDKYMQGINLEYSPKKLVR